MNLTGQEIVRRLLELPPIVDVNGKATPVTKQAIMEFTQTRDWQNVNNWLRGKFDPQPHHLARLKQMLIQERAKRMETPIDSQQREMFLSLVS
jgi:hypothetical protein